MVRSLVFAIINVLNITVGAVPVCAVELTGYYKNLLIGSETVVAGDSSYWWDINRLRLDLSQEWNDMALNLVYDNEIQTGSYLDTVQFRQSVEKTDPRYWKLQGNTVDREDVYGQQEIYRATVSLEFDRIDLRFGRQQINWATAVIWNPIDLFNPLNPLQLERDERQGIDALLVDVEVDELSRLSVAYAPGHQTDDKAARYRGNTGMLDWSLMAGEFSEEVKVGLSLAGQIGLVGLRSEIVLSDSDRMNSVAGQDNKHYMEWVAGADYTFYNGLTLMLESYFNGAGESNSASYDFVSVLNGKKLAVGRHYLGLRAAKEISALLNIELLMIRNMDDQSHFLFPSISYAVPGFEDLYLGAGAQLFDGNASDEYGFFNDLYYGELHYYF